LLVCALKDLKEKEMAQSFSNVYQLMGKLVPLITGVISYDFQVSYIAVSRGARENVRQTLFRGANFSTVLFSAVFHDSLGKDYLVRVVGPLVNAVSKLKHSIDMNPATCEGFADRNEAKLREIVGDFFESLISNINHVPTEMKETLSHLNNQLLIQFPEMVRPIIAVFVFLRFLCPSIVSPHYFGVVKEVLHQRFFIISQFVFLQPPTREVQIALILVSKLVAKIGGGAKYDYNSREVYMIRINPFISAMKVKVAVFIEGLISFYPNTENGEKREGRFDKKNVFQKVGRRERRERKLAKHKQVSGMWWLVLHLSKWKDQLDMSAYTEEQGKKIDLLIELGKKYL